MHVIDIHNHLGKDIDGWSQTPEELLSRMKEAGVDRAVVFPFDDARLDRSFYEANKWLANLRREEFIPFMRLDPHCDENTDLIPEFASWGMYGIKIHPRSQKFRATDKLCSPVYEVATELNLPVIIHCDYWSGWAPDSEIIQSAENFPKCNFIVAHAGFALPSIFGTSVEIKNLYVDTSFISPAWFIRLNRQREFAPKLLFGSDSPFSDALVEKLKITRRVLDPNDEEAILSGNALKLLPL